MSLLDQFVNLTVEEKTEEGVGVRIDTIEQIKEVLSALLDKMTIEFSSITVYEEEDQVIRVNIQTEKAPLLIGFRGGVLESLQHIFKNILWERKINKDLFVYLDVDDYKFDAKQKILEKARVLAGKVAETGQEEVFPPMSAELRRMVHLEISKGEFEGVKTESFDTKKGERRLKLFKED